MPRFNVAYRIVSYRIVSYNIVYGRQKFRGGEMKGWISRLSIRIDSVYRISKPRIYTQYGVKKDRSVYPSFVSLSHTGCHGRLAARVLTVAALTPLPHSLENGSQPKVRNGTGFQYNGIIPFRRRSMKYLRDIKIYRINDIYIRRILISIWLSQ